MASAREVASVPEGSRVPRTTSPVDVGDGDASSGGDVVASSGGDVVLSSGGDVVVSIGEVVVVPSVGGAVVLSEGAAVVVVAMLPELLVVTVTMVTVEELVDMPDEE